MRITCPTCAAAYDVPDARIVRGGSVRCARCGGNWVPVPAVPLPADTPLDTLEDARPEPTPDAPQPNAPQPGAPAPAAPVPAVGDRRPPWVAAGWVVSVALLGCLAWAAYAWRADVMRVWPPSQRLYAAVGLTGSRLAQ